MTAELHPANAFHLVCLKISIYSTCDRLPGETLRSAPKIHVVTGDFLNPQAHTARYQRNSEIPRGIGLPEIDKTLKNFLEHCRTEKIQTMRPISRLSANPGITKKFLFAFTERRRTHHRFRVAFRSSMRTFQPSQGLRASPHSRDRKGADESPHRVPPRHHR